MPCGNSTGGLDSTLRDCVCAESNEIIVEKDAVGDFLSAKQCASCGTRAIRDELDPYKCVRCPDERMTVSSGQCECNAAFVKVRQVCQRVMLCSFKSFDKDDSFHTDQMIPHTNKCSLAIAACSRPHTTASFPNIQSIHRRSSITDRCMKDLVPRVRPQRM